VQNHQNQPKTPSPSTLTSASTFQLLNLSTLQLLNPSTLCLFERSEAASDSAREARPKQPQPFNSSPMQLSVNEKIKAMLWDLPAGKRDMVAREIIDNPFITFKNNEQLFLNAMNSLSWYDLINLLGKQDLNDLITETTINKLFPPQRRRYYHNAKRLLSKYALSTPG